MTFNGGLQVQELTEIPEEASLSAMVDYPILKGGVVWWRGIGLDKAIAWSIATSVVNGVWIKQGNWGVSKSGLLAGDLSFYLTSENTWLGEIIKSDDKTQLFFYFFKNNH